MGEEDGTERPQCVLCYKVLAEESMKPSKLKAHLVSIHPAHQHDSEETFLIKKALFMARNSLTPFRPQSIAYRKRKFNDSFIKLGFMKFVEEDGTERPQCVLCYKVLAEESMKPSKLKAHLVSIHPTHQHDSEEMFRQEAMRLKAHFSSVHPTLQHSTEEMFQPEPSEHKAPLVVIHSTEQDDSDDMYGQEDSNQKSHLISIHQSHQDHQDHQEDSEDMIEQEESNEVRNTFTQHGFQPSPKPILEASYEVALLIAKEKKAHTIGKTLEKPCAIMMTNLVCGPEEANKLESISLCNNTIKRRIEDMSKDIVAQVTQELRESRCRYSLQLEESTDVASCSQLLVFARYLVGFSVKEEFLFCSPLRTTTGAEDVMNTVNNFMEENDIEWAKLGSLCTDGASAIIGKQSGFVALVKQKCPDVIVTHCVSHRHALATKTLPKELAYVMAIVVTVVSIIRVQALNHRLFQVFCEDIGASYIHLLYHTEVRWLSRGQILNRVLQLRHEIEAFLRKKGNDLADHFRDPVFIARLAYISDIFGHLNTLNMSLQGSSVTIVEAAERFYSLREKLQRWGNRVEERSFVYFPELAQILADDDGQKDLISIIGDDIQRHLKSLSNGFDGYFPNLSVDPWIQDPFAVSIGDIDDNELKDDLIELKASSRLKMQFSTVANPSDFWATNFEAFPNLAAKALRITLPFVTSHLCEAGFSALIAMKTKVRARRDIGPDMRVALSKTPPRIKRLVEGKQEHPSHRIMNDRRVGQFVI